MARHYAIVAFPELGIYDFECDVEVRILHTGHDATVTIDEVYVQGYKTVTKTDDEGLPYTAVEPFTHPLKPTTHLSRLFYSTLVDKVLEDDNWRGTVLENEGYSAPTDAEEHGTHWGKP